MNEEEMVMPILKSCTLAAALALAIASTTLARQSKTITGDTKFVTATVEAIESSSREVTVKKPDGTYDVFYVPAGVKRFDTLKIGDTITAKYYENMVVSVKPAGEKDVDTTTGGVVHAADTRAATTSHQRKITAMIAAVTRTSPASGERRRNPRTADRHSDHERGWSAAGPASTRRGTSSIILRGK